MRNVHHAPHKLEKMNSSEWRVYRQAYNQSIYIREELLENTTDENERARILAECDAMRESFIAAKERQSVYNKIQARNQAIDYWNGFLKDPCDHSRKYQATSHRFHAENEESWTYDQRVAILYEMALFGIRKKTRAIAPEWLRSYPMDLRVALIYNVIWPRDAPGNMIRHVITLAPSNMPLAMKILSQLEPKYNTLRHILMTLPTWKSQGVFDGHFGEIVYGIEAILFDTTAASTASETGSGIQPLHHYAKSAPIERRAILVPKLIAVYTRLIEIMTIDSTIRENMLRSQAILYANGRENLRKHIETIFLEKRWHQRFFFQLITVLFKSVVWTSEYWATRNDLSDLLKRCYHHGQVRDIMNGSPDYLYYRDRHVERLTGKTNPTLMVLRLLAMRNRPYSFLEMLPVDMFRHLLLYL